METYPYSTILTTSGKKINPLDYKPEDVDIQDIAVALAHQNRFGGHMHYPYSVGMHSLVVCSMAFQDDYETQLLALLHDATEGVLVDLPRPYKQFVFLARPDGRLAQFAQVEKEVMATILKTLRLTHIATEERWAKVKKYDDAALDYEKAAIAGFWPEDEEDPYKPTVVFPAIMPCDATPDFVCARFISTFELLSHYVLKKANS